MKPLPLEQLMAQIGKLESSSPWVDVPQSMIDQFAEATHDHQFIHLDAERAKAETPFGGTIAHGFLTLSLLSKFGMDAIPRIENAVMGINYGFEKIRFLNPVPAGSKVRGHFKLLDCTERKPGEILSKYGVSVEIEGEDTPALVAEWLGMAILNTEKDR